MSSHEAGVLLSPAVFCCLLAIRGSCFCLLQATASYLPPATLALNCARLHALTPLCVDLPVQMTHFLHVEQGRQSFTNMFTASRSRAHRSYCHKGHCKEQWEWGCLTRRKPPHIQLSFPGLITSKNSVGNNINSFRCCCCFHTALCCFSSSYLLTAACYMLWRL